MFVKHLFFIFGFVMPLHRHDIIDQGGELGLWLIEEEEDWFLERLSLSESEATRLQSLKGRKRVEWLAVRLLVHSMSGRVIRGPLVKDEFGKPHLQASPFQLSISHSRKLAAAIAAPYSVGIDIQQIVPRIERIKHKYMSKKEIANLQSDNYLAQLHIYWGAKEALYKAYGRRQLDFCQHIMVDPFEYQADGGSTTGKVIKGQHESVYQLQYQLVEDYMLVYALEISISHTFKE
jgi:4'-phosphopantetheinyl transferase